MSLSTAVVDPDEPRELFSIPIHSLLLEAHNAHGLRHSDFSQYRIYCTHRLTRLRHHKPVRKELSYSAAGYKASADRPPIKGGRHAFHPRGSLDESTISSHVNFTLVHLYGAERAWSHGMELKVLYDQLKAQAGTTANKTTAEMEGGRVSLTRSASPGSVRRHYIQRLKKACKNAAQLEQCAVIACDEKTRAECTAYACWIRGNYFFEVGQWEVCSTCISLRHSFCYLRLGHVSYLSNLVV